MKCILPTLLMLVMAMNAMAQTTSEQNPRFAESRDKYMRMADSLVLQQGTTAQMVYKAYDWSQMREDRQYYRSENRNKRRMARAQAPRYYDNGWNNGGYYQPYHRSYWYPNAGYRSQNWWFWLP